MKNKILIATYGSLRKGFSNHYWLGKNPKLIGINKIFGVMYLNGSYPHLYHTKGDPFFNKNLEREHIIELYKISEENFKDINDMEISADYVLEEVLTTFGQAKIWFNPHTVLPDNLEWIPAYTKEIIYQKT